ncbi:hypothetical protein KFL_000390360 [Klebsormidium nitens]|uniref:ESCRT-II complex subunit VPS25 n=1 Tax=Klebsormidium nitens TaxID=105231 RepID=A0A1Y1HTH9_KLENI|nr:hypothetical protein KFL_000390360 [Klebsormidium nitens]|eukprot:GAQ79847.1 hypothetical protein KFL_000390360 [Klebsormidium nitens]
MAPKPAFELPYFYNYRPYFTLQPVRDTREKQIQLWKELILSFCKHYGMYIVDVDDFPLFANKSIERKLTNEARELFLNALVMEGRAEWLGKDHRKCLLLWRRIEDWADLIISWVQENALENGVVTLDEMRTGDEARGTDLENLEMIILERAVRLLEARGKAQMFKGSSADDTGVKFFI